jgi:hypothetical protein
MVVGGLSVHCSDSTGAVVYTRYATKLSAWAMPSIDAASGKRLIVIDRPLTAQMARIVQLFLYAHECAHHLSGDVFPGHILKEADLEREKNADKIGIRLLRDQLHINRMQVDTLATQIQKDPTIFPAYMPGPQRADWIRRCYATSNADCTLPKPPMQQAKLERPPDLGFQRPVDSGVGSSIEDEVGAQPIQPRTPPPAPIAQTGPPARRMTLEDALPLLADASLSGFVYIKYRDTATIALGYGGRTIVAQNVAAREGGLPRFRYLMYSGPDGLAARDSFEMLDKESTDILQRWQKSLKDNSQNLDQDRSWLMHSTFKKKSGSVGQEFDLWLTKRNVPAGSNEDVHFDVYLEAVSASKSIR